MDGGITGRSTGGCDREWTVIAAIFGADQVRLVNAGAVVASDLNLAAEQMRHHVPFAEIDSGACYLVATLSRIDTGPLTGPPLATWVSELSRSGATITLGEWVCAAEALVAAVQVCMNTGGAVRTDRETVGRPAHRPPRSW